MVDEARRIGVLRAVGAALAAPHSPGEVAAVVASVLARELGLRAVAVWLAGEEAPCLAGQGGELSHLRPPAGPPGPDDDPGNTRCVRLPARGRTIGVIVAEPAAGRAVPDHVVAVLELVAPWLGVVLDGTGRVPAPLLEPSAADDPPALVGASPAFRRVMAAVDRLAAADVTVLLLGASGTGKERVARALHERGRRRGGPFVAVNCAALPESLLEAELFGIERGVATGVERRAGLVERAHGGTLFLDEIGDMSPALQAKLLRVLQERELCRVGGARPIAVDARVVAATNRDLAAAVRAGAFREDLYFRLRVAPIRVPSLEERAADVPALAEHFLARFTAKHGRAGLSFAPEALVWLATRPWPGNVRELENAVERAVVMAGGATIGAADLDLDAEAGRPAAIDFRRALATVAGDAERALIERALAVARDNRTHAARLLGIGRRTLLYRLKRYRAADAGRG
jgi:DNA-binding NtrC family response regulator